MALIVMKGIAMGSVFRFLKQFAGSRHPTTKPRQGTHGISGFHRRLVVDRLEERQLLAVGLGFGQALAGLPPAAQLAVSSAIGQDQSAYHAASVAGGVSLANPANGFTAQLQSGSLRMSAGPDTWDMALAGLGYGGAVQPVGTAQTSANGNRVDSNYATIDEWYVNGPGGLEQGFTIDSPSQPGATALGAISSPVAQLCTVAPLPQSGASGLLTVELALGGNLKGTVNAAGDGLTLTRPDGSTALGYTGLTACDATGKALPASLEVRADGDHQDLLIRVNIAGAQGVITIDPLVQTAKLMASDGAVGDGFGSSVSTSGNTIVVGADGDNNGLGAAYVFTASGSTWTQIAKLTPSDGLNGDSFGTSVAISSSGNTIVVGADYASSLVSAVASEAAYVFTKPTSGWASMTQSAKLTASGNTTGNFGVSVAISASGNTVVVGAPQWQNANSGAAYVFTESGSAWTNMTQTAKLTPSPSTEADEFGASLSISGSTLVVGAPGATVNRNGSQGAVFVFTQSASWTQTAELTASDGTVYDNLGDSVSVSGNTVVAGAILNNGYRGAAYVFTESGSAWANMTQTAKLTASDGADDNYFGSAVSISGNTVVVAAGGRSGQQGASYTFTEPGSAWANMSQLANLAEAGTVSISGSTLVIGVAGDSQHQGAAYVFGQGPAASPVITAITPSSGATFAGVTVTITGTGFTGVAAVDFGLVAASSFTVVSNTQITATSPAGSGTVDVTATGPGGTSATSSADRFTYVPVASVVGLSAIGDWQMAEPTGSGFANQYWGSWILSAGWQDVQVGDFNGDGKADIVGMTRAGVWWVALSNGTGFVNQSWGSWNAGAGWQDVHVADVNGDGKADIVGRTSGGDWWVAISTGTSFVNQYWGSWNPAAGWQNVQVADVNGDGKADIVGRTSYGDWWVALSNGTSFVNQYWGSWNPNAGWKNVQVADVNGDHKADIVGMTSSGDWWVAISNGTGFVNQYWGSWNPAANWTNVQMADVNGDGKADIVGMASSGDWWVALSNGTGFVNQYWGSWNPSAGWQDVRVGDFNGDGKADIVGMTSSGDWYVALSSGTGFTNQYWGSWNPSTGWQPVLVGKFS